MHRGRVVKPDCTKCGICCVSVHEQECVCALTHEDLLKFPPRFIAKNVIEFSLLDQLAYNTPPAALRTKFSQTNKGFFAGFEFLVCCQLDGQVGHKVRCRIYKTRPAICRKVIKSGDLVCIGLREAYKKLFEQDQSKKTL